MGEKLFYGGDKMALTPMQELDKFMGGALVERVAVAYSKVAENIFDRNTKPDAKREITIKVSIKPTKSRNEAEVKTSVVTKLAPMEEMETTAQIGVDDQTGELVIVEKTDISPGQIDINGNIHEDKVARFPGIAK